MRLGIVFVDLLQIAALATDGRLLGFLLHHLVQVAQNVVLNVLGNLFLQHFGVLESVDHGNDFCLDLLLLQRHLVHCIEAGLLRVGADFFIDQA